MTADGHTLVFGCKDSVIPVSVIGIGDRTFSGCIELVSIRIPNNVIWIGEYSFYNCTGMTSIKIPDSVAFIGYGAFNILTNSFSYRYSLERIRIHDRRLIDLLPNELRDKVVLI